jgi:kynurenine formamidase
MKLIDLNLAIDEETKEPFPVKIKRLNHSRGADYLGRITIFSKGADLGKQIRNLFQYLTGTRRIDRKSFPDGEFISEERITASVHTGTHLDAPYHFGTKCQGKRAKTIEEIPLEWCYSDGVLLDLSAKSGPTAISARDIEDALERIDYKIKPLDIVLIRTGADKYWGKKEYFYKFSGISEEATGYLVEKGVKIIGIDALGFDRPFASMIEDYFRTKDNKHLWPAHLYGRKREYCHIERLANLDKIPMAHGFKVACFPIKIKRVGASWVRAVAIIP